MQNKTIKYNPDSSSGVKLINMERIRQVMIEGYDKAHDNKISSDQLAAAAFSYISADFTPDLSIQMWPWQSNLYKPKDKMRNYVRAGALIAAAIDRLIEEERVKK